MSYAREAADFSTNQQLPFLEYAVNHYGQADVAMFDFTSMFVAENASRVVEKNGHRLLMGLVGDSLLEVSACHRQANVLSACFVSVSLLACLPVCLNLSVCLSECFTVGLSFCFCCC